MKTTASSYFVIRLEMIISNEQRKFLEERQKTHTAFYNQLLTECFRRFEAYQQDPEQINLQKRINQVVYSIKRTEEGYEHFDINSLKATLKELQKESAQILDKFDLYGPHFLQKYCCEIRYQYDLLSGEAKAINADLSGEFYKYIFGKVKKPCFKDNYENVAIRNARNNSGVCYIKEKKQILWPYFYGEEREKREVSFKLKFGKDKKGYIKEALKDCNVKFVQIVPCMIRGKRRFFAHLYIEGVPPKKIELKEGRVGYDLGVSTVAVASEESVDLIELFSEYDKYGKQIRYIDNKMSRSLRETNPNNFNKNDTINPSAVKENGWVKSKNYQKLSAKRHEICRKLKAYRKQSHNIIANRICSMGNEIYTEKMDFRKLQAPMGEVKKIGVMETNGKQHAKYQKRRVFGKTITRHAPGELTASIKRRLNYYGVSLHEVNTVSFKASQYNHLTGEYHKKTLGERWMQVGDHRVQRDMYSAFLLMNSQKNLQKADAELCKKTFENFVQLHDEGVVKARQNSNLYFYLKEKAA